MGLDAKKVVISDYCNKNEFYYELTNNTDEDIFLKDYVLYEQSDLAELRLNPDNVVMFRSGRHKNDMPSVFKLGQKSAALEDALGSMAEAGGDMEICENESVIKSDHLTIIGNDDTGYLVISFPDGQSQFVETLVYLDEEWTFKRLVSRVLFDIRIAPKKTVKTERIRVEFVQDINAAIEDFANDKAMRFGARNGAHPSVFCTWYYYGLTVTYDDVITNLNKMAEKKLPFDVFQIDEGWEITLGEWGPNHKFPIPMKVVADEIIAKGYRPGIWTSPFVAHETASVWKEHPDWALKDKKGEYCLFPMNDTVYRVLDITNPETYDYFRGLYYRLTFDWGYTYHKLDFTRAAVIMPAAVYFDDTITLVEAYRKAVEAIREGMGEESYFLMCGGLYDPIIGLVDAQRTGSDVLSMWASNINKDGKTAPFTMKQSVLRYYMNAWWNNDPDALMVRRNDKMERNLRLTYGLLNDDEVKTSTINQYMGGGIVCSTEPLDKIEDDRLMNLKRIMPMVVAKVSPLDFMNGDTRFPERVKVAVCDKDISSIVRINWSDSEDMPLNFKLTKDMLHSDTEDENASYILCDYYSGEFASGVKLMDEVSFKSLKPHESTVIKVEKEDDLPKIVGSTGHFSMGGEGIKLSIDEDMLHVTYQNEFCYEVEYKILIPQNGKVINVNVGPFENIDRKWRISDGI